MGRLYFFEGPDGSGKTVMTKYLFDVIRENREYFPYLFTFPNPKAFGYDKIREILKTENHGLFPDLVQNLFVLNMVDSFESQINDILYLYPNSIVLTDRSLISTLIYNNMAGGYLLKTYADYAAKKNNMEPNKVDFDIINKVLTHSIANPSNIFFIMPPLEIILKHSEERLKENTAEVNDRIENVKITYQYYKDAYQFYKSKSNNPDEFVILDEWDLNKPEDENYKKMSETILEMILNEKLEV